MKGFIPFEYLRGADTSWQYYPAAADTVHIGETLAFSTGKVAKASGTTKPLFVCMCEKVASAGDLVPVVQITDDTIFEVELGATVTGLAPGVGVKIDSDGMSIAALGQGETAVFTCLFTTGTAAGDKALVKLA